MADRNLTTAEAAERLGVSASYLNKARLTGDGPIYLKLGHKVVYDPADLTSWLNCRRRSSTSQTDRAAA